MCCTTATRTHRMKRMRMARAHGRGNVQCTIAKNVKPVWPHDVLVEKSFYGHHRTFTITIQCIRFIIKLFRKHSPACHTNAAYSFSFTWNSCTKKKLLTIISSCFWMTLKRIQSIEINIYLIIKSRWFTVTYLQPRKLCGIFGIYSFWLWFFFNLTGGTPSEASLREINVQNKNKIQTRAYIGTVAGQRGNPKLVLNGYTYIPNKRIKEKTYWNCAHVRQKKCKARLISLGSIDNIVVTYPQHTHPKEIPV